MSEYKSAVKRTIALSAMTCLSLLVLASNDTRAQTASTREQDPVVGAPTPPASQDVADRFMREYEASDGFGDVIITSDASISVLSTMVNDRELTVDGVTVTFRRVRHSRAEFDLVAQKVLAANHDVQLVSYDFERSEVTLETSVPETVEAQLDLSAVPNSMTVELLETDPFGLDAGEDHGTATMANETPTP